MPASSISKPQVTGAAAAGLGREIRRRRLELGLTQAQVASPMTRAYVSAVEQGRCSPSLAALIQIAMRLDTTPAKLLDSVNPRLALVYTARHATDRQREPSPHG